MSIGILSWGAHQTLRSTLESYRRYGLDTLDEDRLIFFQEISSEDHDIAEEFGYEVLGASQNIGIAAAYQYLVEYASGDLFLFLENDWELVESEPTHQIIAAQELLYAGVSDLVRLRHRTNPGDPLWTRQFAGREYERPTHLLDAVHWSEDPESLGLEAIRVFSGKEQTFYRTTARNANWTNNPHLAPTKFLKDNVLPRIANGDLEGDIQGWWEQQDFLVAQGDGLFTHRRLDK